MSLIRIDIQAKKYRPSAIWKRIDDGEAKAQYALPTPVQTPPSRDLNAQPRFTTATCLKTAGSKYNADEPSKLSDTSNLSANARNEEHTDAISNSSEAYASDTRVIEKLRRGALASALVPGPRRFHLTENVSASLAPHSPSTNGVQKNKRQRKGDLAVFVEKATRNHSDVKAQRALESIGRQVKAQADDTKAEIEYNSPRKRPITTAAENARKASTQDKMVRRDMQNGITKTGQSIDTPSNQWDYSSEELAEQLHAFSLEQTAIQEIRTPHELGRTNLKHRPKPPKPRQPVAQTSDIVKCDPLIFDNDEGHKHVDADCLYDTYVRTTWSPVDESPQTGVLLDPLLGVSASRIGVLVIEEAEQALWDSFGMVEAESDPEWNSEEDDENGKCENGLSTD